MRQGLDSGEDENGWHGAVERRWYWGYFTTNISRPRWELTRDSTDFRSVLWLRSGSMCFGVGGSAVCSSLGRTPAFDIQGLSSHAAQPLPQLMGNKLRPMSERMCSGVPRLITSARVSMTS